MKLLPNLCAMLLLTGCASVKIEQQVAHTNQIATEFTYGQLHLAQDEAQRAELARRSQALLQGALTQRDAVLLALANSPALQALLFDSAAQSARAAQAGRLPNPLATFENLRAGNELELGRILSFGLLDLVTLPQRHSAAQQKIAHNQLLLVSDVIKQLSLVRQAWVNAVAAQQSLQYAKQIMQAADASAELAQRLRQVGNFSKLQHAREQAFYADAIVQVAHAEQAALAAREELVRSLGLDAAQAAILRLPDRLGDLPSTLRSEQEVKDFALVSRLDIQLAKAQLAVDAKAQGMKEIQTWLDLEFGVRRETSAAGSAKGIDATLRLPLFDLGEQQRTAMSAQTLASSYRLQAASRLASSHLRQSYATYQSSYQIARHYRDEILPLRKAISAETMLRYNGMLTSVFDVLADARQQIAAVQAAIAAQQQFWLAEANLQTNVIGIPSSIDTQESRMTSDAASPH